MIKPFLVDVPVAMFFFSRPDQFRQIFESVKKARPSKIFFIADGPRNGRIDDIENVKKCKAIAEEVDWDCEIFRNYSDKNLGCGYRIFTGLNWVFEHTDRAIILEDDTLPCLSWFKFAAEVLERYKNDERIGMITGVNHLGKYDADGVSSYFFATCGSIAGWATWKRVWNLVDFDVEFAENKYYMSLIKRNYYPEWKSGHIIKNICNIRKIALKKAKRNSWSGPFGFMSILQSRLMVVPTINMITNIGLVPGATNGGTCKAILPKKLQSIFGAPTYEMMGKIIHPKYVIEDKIYNDNVQIIMNGGKSVISRFIRKLESVTRILFVKYLNILK